MALVIKAPVFALPHITNEQRLKLVFFGTPLFAVPSLRALYNGGWPIALVVTAPDKPVGRNQILTPSPVKAVAKELSLPVSDAMTDVAADLGIIVAYNKIIPQSTLDKFPRGVVNVHPSLLPKYRGPSPIQSAILNGETTTGVSIMLVDSQVDHGPVLSQESWQIPGGFDYLTCESELALLGADLLVKTLESYVRGTTTGQIQDHDSATFTKKFKREDGRIDWSQPANEIVNSIRALGSNPGTWTTWNKKVLNILHAHVESDKVVIDDVQLEGGTPMTWTAFRRGHSGELV